MHRWEYMTVDLVKRKNEIEVLKRLGQEGAGSRRDGLILGRRVAFRAPHRAAQAAARNDAEGSPG
jgi:hypothetical protein